MAKFFSVGIALFLWAFLLYFCIPHAAHKIEQDIAARSAQVVSPEYISVDGRDVTLTGRGVSDETVKRVAALWGVRSVHTLPKETH